MNEDMGWVKDLKQGDEIAVDESSTWYRNYYKILTVEKITPTGRIKLSDGSQYYPDGRKVGDNYKTPLRQITPEILELIKRRKLLNELNTDKFIGKLSSERLELLLEWQKELLKDDTK